MYLFCERCQKQFPAGGECPRCSSRLISPGELADVVSKPSLVAPPRPIQTSFAGRVTVGCVVALGLHLALREWAAAGMMAIGSETGIGLWVGFLLRGIALIPAAVLAGSGRSGAFTSGSIVGSVVALAWLVIDPFPTFEWDLTRGILGIVLVAIGATGAFIGSRIWPPATDIPTPTSPRDSSRIRLTGTEGKRKTRPTQWPRIVLSTGLVASAILMADTLRMGMSRMPTGMFQVNGPAAQRVAFELTVPLMILAAMVGGASTGAPTRHAFLNAGLTATMIIGLYNFIPSDHLPGIEYYLSLVDDSLHPGVALTGTVYLLTFVSTWLGGQLFPAISRRRMKRVEAV